MIVKVQTAPGTIGVRYGVAEMMPAEDGSIDVPAYVAKTIAALPSFACAADLTASVANLLAATADEWECNYLFNAYGLAIPGEARIAAAQALLATRGAPNGSAT